MRFGVALDLWAKEDISHDGTPAAKPAAKKATNGAGVITAAQVKRFWVVAREKISEDRIRELLHLVADVDSSKDIPQAKYEEVIEALEQEEIPF